VICQGLGSHPGLVNLWRQEGGAGKGVWIAGKYIVGAKPGNERNQITKTVNSIEQIETKKKYFSNCN
jgi:hypothetical protein